MATLTRQEIADAVLAQLRGVGPQTVPEIQADLGLKKRQVTDALYLLMNRNEVEYDYPTRSPLAYKVTVMREP